MRAAFEIEPPPREAGTASNRIGSVRMLGDASEITVLVCDDPGFPAQYKIDHGIEPVLSSLLTRENQRLATLEGRGHTRMVIMVRVSSVEDAKGLLHSSRHLKTFPLEQLGAGFFGRLFAEPVTVVRSGIGAPSIIENAEGRYLPIMVEDYRDDHVADADRFSELQKKIARPTAWQSHLFPVTRGEIGRIKRLLSIESGFPKGLLSRRDKQAFIAAPETLEALEADCRSATPPKLMKQIVWVELDADDRPKSVYRLAKDQLFGYGYLVRSLTATEALSTIAALMPGMARFSADARQGLGRILSHDEWTAELSTLGRWRGHTTPSVIAHDHRETVALDLFAGDNPNTLVIGPSGSGKSVFLAGLISAHLGRSRDNRVLIVDYGGSFDGLVDSLGGRQFAYGSENRLQISPIPELPEDETVARELGKQALLLVSHYLCSREITDTKVFQRAFLESLLQAPRDHLKQSIQWIISHARKQARTSHDEIEKEAWQQLRDVWLEVEAVSATSPVIGDNRIDFRGERVTSFNLDGYAADDKLIVLGLITILIQQVFAVPQPGRTLIVFDEGHMFLLDEHRRPSGIGNMLDRLARVTRKYGAALLIATQSPSDLDVLPSLPQNAAHHVVMRFGGESLLPHWRIQRPEILRAAREAPPVTEVGYSTLHIGTASAESDLELALAYHLTPDAQYLFTSRARDKQIMAMTLALTGLPDYAALAAHVHGGGSSLVPIGSPHYWDSVGRILLPRFAPLASVLPSLFGDLESCPLLTLYIDDRETWKATCSSPETLRTFMEANHATIS